MGLKFFADHCVPASVIQSMRDAGHEVLRLKEHIPQDCRQADHLPLIPSGDKPLRRKAVSGGSTQDQNTRVIAPLYEEDKYPWPSEDPTSIIATP